MVVLGLEYHLRRGFGDRLTAGTFEKTEGSDGYVVERPEDLARAAGLDLERYTVARALRSEGYGFAEGRAHAGVLIAQCLVNRARAARTTVTELALKRRDGHSGRYGTQAGNAPGFSTKQDPRDGDALIAGAVLRGDCPDHAAGATSFLDPKGMGERLVETLGRWHDRGLAWVGDAPGVNPWRLVALRPERDAGKRARALEACLEQVAAARAGKRGAAPMTKVGWLVKLLGILLPGVPP